MKSKLAELAGALGPDSLLPLAKLEAPERKSPGLNDGLIIPGSYFPLGTSVDRVRSAALERPPLRGKLRVVVVLVDFSDRPMVATVAHFEELFFSTGKVPKGSVKEYFTEASNGLVEIAGEVVGPYRMPLTLAEYANGESGTGAAAPNARTLARHAAEASDGNVEFGPYDNDNNGFVDAFIVVHAGPGGEVTGNGGHVWSHKWVLSGGEYPADSTKIYGYLTVPEDARIGVCAHELGHLLFGWPDLYDTDGSSEGIGNWCLMAGGSWNDGGDVPAHPSAWCKVNQGWVSVANQTVNGTVAVADVKDAHTVYRLWKDGGPGREFFLLENRQRTRFDAYLPGEGLLIWHVDEAMSTNSDESHYRVALVQADGKKELETSANRGDAGDCFPGSTANAAFTNTSTPSSKSYGGLNTSVSVTAIGEPGPVMPVTITVVGKSGKETKEGKELAETGQVGKPPENVFVTKAYQYDKGYQFEKPAEKPAEKPPEKPSEKPPEKPGEVPFAVAAGPPQWTVGGPPQWTVGVPPPWEGPGARLRELEARVAALEAALSAGAGAAARPFIDASQRPDLRGSTMGADEDARALGEGMASGDPNAKRLYDSKPAEG